MTYRVLIVGGGISGLSAAHFLEKAAAKVGIDLSIDLIERRDRLGGVIVSERIDGSLLEGGPDSFLTQKPSAIELCRSLGLGDQLIPSNDAERKTYILQGGKLKELPDGLLFMLPTKVLPILRSDLFSFSGKLRLAISPLLSKPIDSGDVPVTEYISRRLGREALERLAEPLLSAVYGADVNTLSSNAVLERFVQMETKYGTLWNAIRAIRKAPAPKPGERPFAGSLFISLRDGLGQMVAALERSLARTSFAKGIEITDISRNPDGTFRARAAESDAEYHAVILATPAHAAARLLKPLDTALAERLEEIPYHSTMTVSMAFPQGSFGRRLDGFGYVVSRSEGKRMVACTWVSTKFPFRSAPNSVLIRAFLGGSRDPQISLQGDDWIRDTVIKELGEVMGGVKAQPTFCRIHRWDRAMPQYLVGHIERVQTINERLSNLPGLFLAGNAYKGMGIPDCIDTASRSADSAFRYCQRKVESSYIPQSRKFRY